MGRTKSGTKIKDTQTFKIRLPDGTMIPSVSKPYKELHMVQVPVSIERDYSFFSMETGIGLREWAPYLPEKKMFLFLRGAKDEHDFKLMMREWATVCLGGRKKKAKELLGKMKEAPNRKEANRLKQRYYKKYGWWMFGLHAETRTIGLKNLLAKKEEFSHLLNTKKETASKKERPISNKPRLAWHTLSR